MNTNQTNLNVTVSGRCSDLSEAGRSSGCATQVVIKRNPPTQSNLIFRSRYNNMEDRASKRNNILRVGAWNVRTLRQIGKLEMLKLEMRKLEINALGISEMRWPQKGDFWSGEYRVIHTGNNPTHGTAGVGVVLDERLGKLVDSYLQFNERILLVRIKTKPTNTVLVQVYMPTSACEDEEIEVMYDNIEEVIKYVKGDENLIVMGDWNAIVGEGKVDKIVGKFGLGKRNERGERLIEFCQKYKLVVTNTLFQNHKRRLYTCKLPGDICRVQNDFILVKQRFRNQVHDSKCFPGADIDSDHNLLVMKCVLKLKRLYKGAPKKRWDIAKLKQQEVQEEFEKNIYEEIRSIENVPIETQREWSTLKEVITKNAEQVIGFEKRQSQAAWITGEIVDLIEKRRSVRSDSTEEGIARYKFLKNQITNKCRQAKETWMKDKCEQVQSDLEQGKVDKAFKTIKRVFQEHKPRAVNLKDSTGKFLIREREIVNEWKRYLENLYGENEQRMLRGMEEEESVDLDKLGEPILRSEFDLALRQLKNNKASGVDNLPAELLKQAGQYFLDRLFVLINEIYKTGSLPNDFKMSKIVTLPKKANSEKCEDFRTISLLSHASKILTKVINRRIEHVSENYLAEDQFGFRRNKGTRDAILALRLITAKRRAFGQKTAIAFIDLEKAFDNVNWEIMFKILEKLGIKYRDRRVLFNLYKEQMAVIEIGKEKETAEIRKGVRQGCALSPVLFNLYIEDAMNRLKMKDNIGIRIQGENVSMIRFADDIALLAENEEALEASLQEMASILRDYGMKINKKKTKVLVSSKGVDRIPIRFEGEYLQRVEEFSYLGSKISSDCKCKGEIQQRIIQAKRAFISKRSLLCCKKINLETRKNFLKMYVWSVALYGSETWTLLKGDMSRLEAFEMWCFRRMLRISYIERVTNDEVLRRIGEQRAILKTIKRRRDKLIGHTLRHESILQHILESGIGKKTQKGRPPQDYCRQIIEDVACGSYREMKDLARNRELWRARSNQ